MIYGDNPNKINEREDALGLKAYTYTPSIGSIMQSGNLYVYCINDPISFVDDTGCALRWPGEIHNAVVNDIASQYKGTVFKEVWLIGENGKLGRADIVSTSGKIWEVKSQKFFEKYPKATNNQLDNYVGGKLIKHDITTLCRGDDYIVGRTFFYPSETNARYKITYRNSGNGIITYDFVEIKQPQKTTVTSSEAAVAVAVAVIITIVVAACTGVYAPIPARGVVYTLN